MPCPSHSTLHASRLARQHLPHLRRTGDPMPPHRDTGDPPVSGIGRPGGRLGRDPLAALSCAPPPGSPPGEGVPTLASHRVATAASGRPCTDGGRRGAEKERRAFTPCTRRATLGFAA